MNLVALLVAAAPLLEPDPGKLVRVQPRGVSSPGTSDTALWAVDDDPATGWKALLKDASLEWRGAARENVTGMKVFIRSGCQESKESFAAYGRPSVLELRSPMPHYSRKHMVLMPPRFADELLDGDSKTDKPKGPPTVELKDVEGWQELPLPRDVSGLRNGFTLKVKDRYPGKGHDEVCISDLRVYLETKEPIDSSEEQLAFDGIKRSIAETLARPANVPRRLPVKFSVEEIDVDTPQPVLKGELALQSPNAYPAMVKRARQAAAELRAVWRVPVSQLEANGWKRASIEAVQKNDGALEASLNGVESISQMGDTLMASEDFKLVSATSPLVGLKALAGKMQKLAEKPLECASVCLPAYSGTMTSVAGARGDCDRVCGYGEGIAAEMRADLGGSGIFVKGGLDKPREVLLVSSREGGEREIMRRNQRELFVYDNGRVSAVASISYDPQYVDTQLVGWNAERAQVASVVRIMLQGSHVEMAELRTAKDEHASLEPAIFTAE